MFNRFLNDKRGNFAVTFGVLLLPIMAICGAAIDYARMYTLHDKMQHAADSAVLAAAHDANNSQEFSGMIRSFMSANFEGRDFKIDTILEGGTGKVSISSDLSMTFLSSIGEDEKTITVTAEVSDVNYGSGGSVGGSMPTKKDFDQARKDLSKKIGELPPRYQQKAREITDAKLDALEDAVLKEKNIRLLN